MNNVKRLGFTLIELLVVVAIIAIISAILLPVLSQVRKDGRRTVCINNLRQIGMAMLNYDADYDGFFPPGYDGGNSAGCKGYSNCVYAGFGAGWTGQVYPYIGKSSRVFICPDDPAWRTPICSYAINANIAALDYGTNSDFKLSRPSITIMLFETQGQASQSFELINSGIWFAATGNRLTGSGLM